MGVSEISRRYTQLANSECCISCGGAVELSGASPGEICVDLGSGRGTDVLRLAGIVGEEGHVYGVDSTTAMIKKAVSAAMKLRISNAEFILAGLENIPLEDNIADLVISNCVINHIAEKKMVWSEIYRLLKKGGRFVVSDIYSVDIVPEEYSSDPVAVAECWAGAVTRNSYLHIIESAGFGNIRVLEESKPYDKGKISVCSFTVSGIK